MIPLNQNHETFCCGLSNDEWPHTYTTFILRTSRRTQWLHSHLTHSGFARRRQISYLPGWKNERNASAANFFLVSTIRAGLSGFCGISAKVEKATSRSMKPCTSGQNLNTYFKSIFFVEKTKSIHFILKAPQVSSSDNRCMLHCSYLTLAVWAIMVIRNRVKNISYKRFIASILLRE